MKKHSIILSGLTAVLLSAAVNVQAAAYMKLGDIKGESSAQTSQTPRPGTGTAHPNRIKVQSGQPVALLLPAVQQAREAARRP